MENQILSVAEASPPEEIISDSFVCCVCLDLLYKPIVLSCGHVSCFWCVHHSMNGMGESHCPICRHTYTHFPTVCQMLHFLLLKMYPVAYNRREDQIIEEEKKTGFFSPQIDAHVHDSHASKELDCLDDGDSGNSSTASGSSMSSDHWTSRKGDSSGNMDQLGPALLIQSTCPDQNSDGTPEVMRTIAIQEKETPQDELNGVKCNGSSMSSDHWTSRKGDSSGNMDQLGPALLIQSTCPDRNSDGTPEVMRTIAIQEKETLQDELNIGGKCKHISVADVLCSTCKNLLYRPVVLNCGHVHCESCVVSSADAMLRCHVCQSLHPLGFPKVCLELDHFLEQNFHTEYAARKATAQLELVNSNHEKPFVSCSKEADKKGLRSPEPTGGQSTMWSDPHSSVHIGIGCDSCGMYPLVGDRYKCIDCTEEVGFDLCGECYNTRSKLPGRFNQQHTPEHRFERKNRNTMHSLMVRWVGSHASENASDRSEWLRAINRAWSETSETSEYSENGALRNSLAGFLSNPENSDIISSPPTLPGDFLISLLSDSLQNGSVPSIVPGTVQESNTESGMGPQVDQNDTAPTS